VSFTIIWEIAKFQRVCQSNFEEKFSSFLIVEIFHALMTALLLLVLVYLGSLATFLIHGMNNYGRKRTEFSK